MDSASARADFGRLVFTIAIVIILLDQLSKAWMVYDLSSYKLIRPQAGFGEFAKDYFRLWESPAKGDGIGKVTERYGPLENEKLVWEPWIRWHLTTNTGAAWSLFRGNSFALSFVSLLIVVALLYAWRRAFRYNMAMSWAAGGICGGAIGNFLDRFRLHEVVDFIFCKIPLIGRVFPKLGDPYDFPIFNLADACAVCGTIALALYLAGLDMAGMKRKSSEKKAQARAQSFEPYPGGLALDDEASRKLHEIDTTSLPPWEPRAEEPAAADEPVAGSAAEVPPAEALPGTLSPDSSTVRSVLTDAGAPEREPDPEPALTAPVSDLDRDDSGDRVV